MTGQAVSPLRRRMIEDMAIRKLAPKTTAPNRATLDCSDRVVDYCCYACSLSLDRPYCCLARISQRARMNPGARSLILTESQAACLAALRLRKESKTEIAIQAKLDLKRATVALDALKELGLARRGAMSSWHPTRRGRNCRFKATPDRIRPGNALPGPGARRLLDVLDRPMQGNELAEASARTSANRLLVLAAPSSILLSHGLVRSVTTVGGWLAKGHNKSHD